MMKNKKPSRIGLLALFMCCLVGFQPFGRTFTRYLFLRFDPSGELIFSAGFDDVQRMNASLDYGADVNARGSYVHRTPLMVAAIHGKTEAVRFLLTHGADPNLTDDKGLTALRIAYQQQYPEVALVLLAAGAKP